MADLTLRQLKVFEAVARTEHLGISAEQLYLTRGAVSQAIQALESTLGVALFERQTQRLKLNRYGQQLLPYAQQLLASQQQIQRLFDPLQPASPIRLGASRTIGNYLLPQLLAGPLQGLVEPTISLQNSQQLQMALQNFQLDAALIESEHILPGMRQVRFQRDPLCIVAPLDHPLAHQTVAAATLAGQAFIVREHNSGVREQFDLQLAPQLPHYRIAYEFNSLEAILASVAAGLGIALVSKLSAEPALKAHSVAPIYLETPLSRYFSLVYLASNQGLPGVAQLQQRLLQLGGLDD